MTQRVESGVTYTQTWDADNRLVEVVSGTQHTQYFYDADGQRVKRVTPQSTIWYVSADYEVTGPEPVVTVTVPATYTHKLYFPIIANSTPPVNLAPARVTYRFNGQQVAVREGVTLTFVHGDHIGSTSLTTDISGTVVSEMRYYPFGETRYSSGNTPTNKRFTSQEEQAGIGLYSFGARFYSPLLGRFISADSIVPRPGNPQSLNRFAYGLNNPLRYTDPTGHDVACAGRDASECGSSKSGIDSPYWIDDYCKGSYSCEQHWLGWYLKNAPDYNPLTDPNRYQDDELRPFFQRVIMVYAQNELDNGREGQAYQYLQGRYGGALFAATVTDGPVIAGSLAPSIAGAASRIVRNVFGQPGKPAHVNTVARLRAMANSEFANDPTVVIKESVSIANATGGNVNRKPDVSA